MPVLTAHNGSSRLLTLEAGRFCAAAAVMLFHYTSIVGDFTGTLPFNDLFRPGHVAVPFFFTLSGFIIYHIHRPDVGKPETFGHFVVKRAIRLYPMFLAVSVVMLAGFLAKPGLSGDRLFTPSGVVADLLLLPHSHAILSISWTLRHEFIFYSLFACALLFGRRALGLVVLWVLVSVVLSGTTLGQDLGGASLIGTVLNLGFLFGIGAAAAFYHLPTRFGGFWALGSAAVIVILCTVELSIGRGISHDVVILGRLGDVAYLAASATLIYGLVNLERHWAMPYPRLWAALGGSSYLLYLLQQPLASLAMRIPGVAHAVPPEVLFILLSIFVILMALAAHLMVERRILRWLSALTRRKDAMQVAAA